MKTPLKDKVDILYKSALLVGLFIAAINYLMEKGFIQYQNGKVLVMPLVQYSERFRWISAIVALVGLLILGRIIYRSLLRAGNDLYSDLLVTFIILSISGLTGSLYALSTPHSVSELVLVLAVVVIPSVYVTIFTIRTAWATLFNP